jgi:2-oxoisovalerate dehydrogenase E1 component subunit beta
MATLQYIDAIRSGLVDEMSADSSVLVMGEDVEGGGVFKVTEGLLDKFGPERVIDMPLAESCIVGVAIGAAMNGMRPVAEIQFADFIFPAMDQIISEAARICYRSNGGFNCPIVVRVPFGGGIHGALYHSQSVEAFFFHVPGLKIVVPSTPSDAKGLLRAAIRDDDPVMYFEHKKAYRLLKDEVPEGDYTVPIGKAAVRREGDHLTIITYGLMVSEALKAAETLSEEDDVECHVLDLRSLRPLDKEAILDSSRRTGKVLIVHEDNLTGGVGAEIAAIIAEEAFENLDAPVMRVASPDVPAFPYADPLEHFCLVEADKILESARRLAAY